MDNKLFIGIGVGFLCLIAILGVFFINQTNPTIEYIEKYDTQILRELDRAYTPDLWETNGRYDWIENNKGIFNITHKSSTPIIELTSKNYEGDVMFFTGFNTNDIKPIGAWLYKSNGYKIYNHTYTCDYKFNNSGKLFHCFEEIISNQTTSLRTHFKQKVDGGNPKTATVWYTEIDYWKPLNASIFHKENLKFQNNNKWYFKDFTVQANKTYKIKLQFRQSYVNMPSAKYWAGFVPYDEELSYKDNFIEAILNNKGIFVDPWTDSLRSGLTTYHTLNNSQTDIGASTSIDIRNNQNATWNTAVTTGVTGKLGEAYDFDNNEYLNFTNNSNLYTEGSNTAHFSVCLWLNSTNGASYNFIHKAIVFNSASTFDWRGRFGTDTIVFYIENGVDFVKTNAVVRNSGLWNHICFVYDGTQGTDTTRAKIYVNGTDETIIGGGTISALMTPNFDYETYLGVALQGYADELGIWNRTLSQAEVTALWNGGAGLPYAGVGDKSPIINLNNPTVAQNITDISDITFNCTATDDQKVENVSLYINNTINITNSTPVNNSAQLWIVNLANGKWNWTCGAFDNATIPQETIATERRFNVSDQRDIDTDLISPVNSFNTTNSWVNFIYNATPTGINATNTTLYVWFNNGTLINSTFTDFVDDNVSVQTITNVTGFTEIANGYKWNAQSCGDNGEGCTFAVTNRTFDIDFTKPEIIITFPTGTLGAVVGGSTLNLNWSVAEAGESLNHIANCSYTYNGATTNLNFSVCTGINATTFSYSAGVDNITMNVTDVFGLTNFSNSSWIVSLSEINQTFNNITTEGAIEDFEIFVSVSPRFFITATRLLYNGTSYTGTLTNIVGQVYKGTRSLTIPSVSTDTNISFKWEFVLNDTSTVNSLTKNQTIQDITIDDCGANTVSFLNLFVRDEEIQNDFNATLFNTTVEVDLDVFSNDLSVDVFNYSNIFNQTNEVNICFNNNITSYKYDATIRYEAINYSNEYYHIQRSSVTNATLPINITLYDLKLIDATEFQITFKNSEFLIVEDALINIARQYVSEGVFKTVEIPKTDSNGKTVAHLVESDVKYNMIVTKNGEVLGTFSNLIAYCEDLASGSCFISLNAVGTNTPIFNYNDSFGIAYDIVYDKDTRVLDLSFVTTDGTIKTINMTAIKMDQLGNTTACNEVLVSSAGTITCTVPTSIGNDTLFINIYVDEALMFVDYVQAGKPFDSGDFGYFFLIFMLLSFPLMLSQTKIGIVIGTILGFMASSLLSFIEGGIIGFGASIMWLIIAGVILIYTLNTKRET